MKHTRLPATAGTILTTFTLALASTFMAAPAQALEAPLAQGQAQAVQKNPAPQAEVLPETDRLIVVFKEEDKGQQKQALAETATESAELDSLKVVKESVAEDSQVVVVQNGDKLTKEEQKEAIKALENDPRIESVEPDRIVRAVATHPTTEPHFARQWALASNHLNAQAAWAEGVTGRGQTVAIVDTGHAVHPDLNNPVAQYDFVSSAAIGLDGNGRDASALDPGARHANANWHGHFIHGQIAAKVNNYGMAGLAYNADIVHARALGLGGDGYTSDIADAIIWSAGGAVPGVPANPRPATVINASLAYPSSSCSAVMSRAINFALSREIPVVVAAGNAAANANNYEPANCYRAIVVGASNSQKGLSFYSNYGSALDLVAPGGDAVAPIYSTVNTGFSGIASPSYGTKMGTSMAAPHVAATIALMKEAKPDLTVEQIRQTLVSTGTPLGGYRALNPAAAVKSVKPRFSIKANSGIASVYYGRGGAGTFGEPITNEYAVRNGGVAQRFSKNFTIYWHANFGASAVNFSSPIGAKYRASGAENGYGFPLLNETAIRGGAMQKFSQANGSTTALYRADSHGRVHTVYEAGAIGGHFTLKGGTNTFGFPIEDETDMGVGGGWRQIFVSGNQINRFYWSPFSNGVHIVKGNGGIYSKWLANNGTFTHGYPSTDEQPIGQAVQQIFRTQSGGETAYVWHPTHGTYTLNAKGAIYDAWKRNGFTSRIGYPVTDETRQKDGSVTVRFSSGTVIRWTAQRGAVIGR